MISLQHKGRWPRQNRRKLHARPERWDYPLLTDHPRHDLFNSYFVGKILEAGISVIDFSSLNVVAERFRMTNVWQPLLKPDKLYDYNKIFGKPHQGAAVEAVSKSQENFLRMIGTVT